MVGGLWAGSTSLTQDFSTVVWRMQLLGFNAVRLPFSFQARSNHTTVKSMVFPGFEEVFPGHSWAIIACIAVFLSDSDTPMFTQGTRACRI